MRKALLTFSVLFIAAASYAQYTFPLSDLQKLPNKNASDFETFVMEKDYSFQSKMSSQIMKVYTSDKPGASGKQYVISRYQVPNAMAKVTFTTTDKKYYLELKSKLAAAGIKYVNEENKTIEGAQAACFNYASGGFKVSLCTYTTDVMWYKVEVHF
jgi:hypothetical protein